MVLDWLAENEPDVLVIQETKCEDAKFPALDFEESGYSIAFHGQKSYNGVAIASRIPLTNVRTGFGDPSFPEDCRLMVAEMGPWTIVNTYVPNGTAVNSEKFAYKLRWLERFKILAAQLVKSNPKTVWAGDINIAPTPDDVYESPRHLGGVGHHPEEFKRLDEIREVGLVDLYRTLHPGPGHYTYWDFYIPNAVQRNLGWRIDHIYVPPALVDQCEKCWVDKEPRLKEKPSDHTFVVADFAD